MKHLGSVKHWVKHEMKRFDIFLTTIVDVSLMTNKKGGTMIRVATDAGEYIGMYSQRTHDYLVKKRGQKSTLILYSPYKGGKLLCSVDEVWSRVINGGGHA